MARCGCNPTCSCVINPLDTACINMDVTGLGTPSNPYLVSATPIISQDPNNTLTCADDGLLAEGVTINELDTDSVDMTVTENPNNTFTISADVFLQDDNTGPLADPTNPTGYNDNLLKLNPGQGINGLYVSCEDIQDCVGAAVGNMTAGTCLTYDDATNSLNVEIDPDPDNALGCGTGPSGTGLWVNPTAINAEGAGTECVDIEVTGAGTITDPIVIAGSLIVDPACPLATCGPNGLCVTPTPVAVVDTPTLDLTLTGTGQPGDPWTISGVACAPGLVPADTSCIDMTVTGGTGCADPFVISAVPIIDPDICNELECRAGGLFSPDHGQQRFVGPARDTGVIPGLTGLNGNVNIQLGPELCATFTNTNPCEAVFAEVDLSGTADIVADNGTQLLQAQIDFSGAPGGPYNNGAQAGIFRPTGGQQGTRSFLSNDHTVGQIVAPGASITYCAIRRIIGTNVVNGSVNPFTFNFNFRAEAIF